MIDLNRVEHYVKILLTYADSYGRLPTRTDPDRFKFSYGSLLNTFNTEQEFQEQYVRPTEAILALLMKELDYEQAAPSAAPAPDKLGEA